MRPQEPIDRRSQMVGALCLIVAVPLLLPGCYGTKTLRQPVTVEEIADDVREIRSSQSQIRDDVRAMESQLGEQAETIRGLQAENQYLYQELEHRLASIDARLADVLGRDTGFSGSDPYWSGSAPTDPAVPDWRGTTNPNRPTQDGTGTASPGDAGARAEGDFPSASTRENPDLGAGPTDNPQSLPDREFVADASTDGQSKRVYDQAYLDLTRGNYSLAILGFKEFLRRVPDSDISDNAQYWIGESYYMQGDFRQAIREYSKVLDAHSGGDRVASSLYKLGLSRLQLGDRAEGIDYLRQVYERFPDSEEARLARDKLDTLN